MRSALILIPLLLTLSAKGQEGKAQDPPPSPEPETLLPETPPGAVPPSPDEALPPLPIPAPAFPPSPPESPKPKSSAPSAPQRPAANSEALPPGPVPRIDIGPRDKTGRTFSEESPFVIWGGTRDQRANLFIAAGMVRRDVLDALHLGLEWRNPILIQLREPLAKGTDFRPPVWTAVSQVPGGFRIEINLVPRQGSVPGSLLRENIVRATLADLILRGHEKDDLNGRNSPPPDWLLHGAMALMDYRQLGRMSTTFSTIFQLGRVLSVSEILGAEPSGMDSVSLTIYRVSCCGLLMMLIEQPNGPTLLQKLLPALAMAGDDPAPVIERHFPALSSSSNGLSKWWSLQIAALSQPGLDEVQAPGETEQLLAEALTLRYTIRDEAKKTGGMKRFFSKNKPAPESNAADAKDKNKSKDQDKEKTASAPPPAAPAVPAVEQTCDIREFEKVLPLPDHEAVLNRPNLDLTLLLLRAHPVYRPIIAEYQTVLRNIAKGKKLKEAAATFERLASTRQKLAAIMREIENTLDDYEARQSPEKSGAFEDYLRTAEELERPPAPRPDPVSRYLDAMEAEIGG
ncbi:MAG: hypothetical protein V4726_18830 [Verrucomicrobiota bacterium]